MHIVSRHFKVLIVGAGPAGFYTVDELTKLFSKTELKPTFDIINADAKIGGLVTYGVAPDHPKIRAVGKLFEQIIERENVRYFGNVVFGSDLLLQDCLARYDAVVFSFGAQGDRKLNIPREGLKGSYSAREFVNWYNGHSSASNFEIDLSCNRAIVVGAGNVAADVARILVRSTADLSQTDISKAALDVLRGSKIDEVVVVVRRGPEHVKFTPVELRALGELEGVTVKILNDPAVFDVADLELLEKDERKNLEILKEFSTRSGDVGQKTISFLFNASPLELIASDSSQLSSVRLIIQTAAEQSEIVLSAGLFIRSVGYQVEPTAELPYDKKLQVITNQQGRIAGEQFKNCYVVGWAADGPVGIIGTNKVRARKLAEVIVEDLKNTPLKGKRDDDLDLEQLLQQRKVKYVSGSLS